MIVYAGLLISSKIKLGDEMIRLILILCLFCSVVSAQFNGGTFNNIMNLGDYVSLELVPGTKMSKEDKAVDNLFGKLLGTEKKNENPIITMNPFMPGNGQTWKIVKVNENEYTIFNAAYELGLGIENSSKNEDAKALPVAYNENAADQLFHIVRDTVNFRYGFYFVSKNSGLVLEYDKANKQIIQKKLDYGNANQIWVMSLRKKIRNVQNGNYIVPEKRNAFFPGAALQLTSNSKESHSNWDLINHPTVSGLYYIMNSISKQFLTVPKNSNSEIQVGVQANQNRYNKDGQILYQMRFPDKNSAAFIIMLYPEKKYSLINSDNNLKIDVIDETNTNQHWIIEEGSFTLF